MPLTKGIFYGNQEEKKDETEQNRIDAGTAEVNKNNLGNSMPSSVNIAGRADTARNKLEGLEGNKPSWQGSTWQETMSDLYNQIVNGQQFSYDINADPLYQMYKDMYTQNGQRAMEDTIGTAAGLTGGYGNSYAVTAGNQAYQSYMDQLNDIGLSLYDRAYNQHQDAQNQLYNQFGLANTMYGQDYAQYRDDVSDYYNDLGYWSGQDQYLTDVEYNQYLNYINGLSSSTVQESDRASNAYTVAAKIMSDALDGDGKEAAMRYIHGFDFDTQTLMPLLGQLGISESDYWDYIQGNYEDRNDTDYIGDVYVGSSTPVVPESTQKLNAAKQKIQNLMTTTTSKATKSLLQRLLNSLSGKSETEQIAAIEDFQSKYMK